MLTSTRTWLVTAASLALLAPLLTPQTQAQFYIGAEAGWTGLPYQTDTIPGVTSATVQFNSGFNPVCVGATSGARGASKKNTAIDKTAWRTVSPEPAMPSTG